MSTNKPEKKNSYYLRTQSTILKGEQYIPFNSLKYQLKFKNNSFSKSKNNTPKKLLMYFSTGNKDINFNSSYNFGKIDLNKVSGSSHSPRHLNKSNKNYVNNKNIVPNESNCFSLHGSPREEGERKKNDKNNEIFNNTYTYRENNLNK